MGGDATSATTDIEQFPVAERRGENRERELVPPLVDLKGTLCFHGLR